MQSLNITSEFDINNAHAMAVLSNLAYEDEHTLRNKLVGLRFQGCEFISEGDTQCFVASHADYVVISFRGTEIDNVNDWITDLEFSMSSHVTGYLHSGFYRAFKKVWREIIYHVRQHKKPIFITGHSLGAALAGICAIELRLSGIEVQGVYTFGQPRIGGKTFASNYDQFLKDRTYRIVNNNDIVTRAPPRAMNYVHCGTLKYFKETGELSSDLSDWDRFLDRLHGRFEDIGEWGTDGVKDHSIDEYIRLCLNLIKEHDRAA